MSRLDVIQGRQYADDLLAANTVSGMDKLVAGMQDWQTPTAQHLIDTATQRLVDGINPDYQRGVIERAKETLA
jgi:hypothetical protein